MTWLPRHFGGPWAMRLCTLALGLLLPWAARAGVDYAATSEEWNGLSALVATAQKVDIALQTAAAVDWSQLDEHTVLVLVAPMAGLEGDQLAQLQGFLAAGGRLVVADDFRAGGSWVKPFGIAWQEQPVDTGANLGGNPQLPEVQVEATPRDLARLKGWTAMLARYTPVEFLGHNLKKPVVLNHPASLRLEPGANAALWGRGLGDGDQGWLAEAEYRGGRVLAIADASWMINQMVTRIYENRQFAANVLRYYCVVDRPCKVLLVPSATAVRGVFTPRHTPEPAGWRAGLEALDRLLRGLQRLLRGPLLVPALLALALALVGMPVVLLARQRPPALPAAQAQGRPTSTLAETIGAWLRQPNADYRKPAGLLANRLARMLEKTAGEAAPVSATVATRARRPGLPRRGGGLVDDLVRGGRFSTQAGQRLRQVLSDLQQVSQDDAPPVSRQRFAQLAADVDWAETLLRHTAQTHTAQSDAAAQPWTERWAQRDPEEGPQASG